MAVIRKSTEAADAVPEFWLDTAIGRLSTNLMFTNLINRDADDEIANVGDTVNVTKRGTVNVQQKVEGADIVPEAPSNTKVPIVLNEHWYVSWAVEDTASATAVQSAVDYVEDAMDALAEKIEGTVFALYASIANTVGVAGTDLTEATILAARKQLNDQRCPVSGRNLIISSKDETALLELDKLTDVDRSGTPQGLREAMLGRLYGFDVYMSQLVEEVAGVPTTHNIAFHRNAFMMAFRPMPLPEAGSGAQGVYIVDPQTGLALRYTRGYSILAQKMVHTIDALWGVAAIDEDRLAVDVLS